MFYIINFNKIIRKKKLETKNHGYRVKKLLKKITIIFQKLIIILLHPFILKKISVKKMKKKSPLPWKKIIKKTKFTDIFWKLTRIVFRPINFNKIIREKKL